MKTVGILIILFCFVRHAGAAVWDDRAIGHVPDEKRLHEVMLNDATLIISRGSLRGGISALRETLRDSLATGVHRFDVQKGRTWLGCAVEKIPATSTPVALQEIDGECVLAREKKGKTRYLRISLHGLPALRRAGSIPLGDLHLQNPSFAPHFFLQSRATPQLVIVALRQSAQRESRLLALRREALALGYHEAPLSHTQALHFTRGKKNLLFHDTQRLFLAVYQGEDS